MGWSSANDIFDPVAQALIDLGADSTTKRRVLGDLIKGLQDGDWDTEDESLERFINDADVVAAFTANNVRLPDVPLDVAPQDYAAVRDFAAYLKARREAEARGARLCNKQPADPELAWLACTHDHGHDDDCSWMQPA